MKLLEAPDSVQLKTMQPKMVFFIFWSTTKITINTFFFWLNMKTNFSICQSFMETKYSIICTVLPPDRFVAAAWENHHCDVKKVQMFLQDPFRGWILQAASLVLCQSAGQQLLQSCERKASRCDRLPKIQTQPCVMSKNWREIPEPKR